MAGTGHRPCTMAGADAVEWRGGTCRAISELKAAPVQGAAQPQPAPTPVPPPYTPLNNIAKMGASAGPQLPPPRNAPMSAAQMPGQMPYMGQPAMPGLMQPAG
eukprot:3570691-Rhodomonas_salina.1